MKRILGFTLIEIMIVVAIIGLLMIIGIPGFMKARSAARKNKCFNNMRIIAHAVQQYTIDNKISSDITITIYGTLMPASGEPDINNTTLDVTCPATANSHGTFGDLD
ncbi:MAG: prepilin-type N-terminal cleavage/methylation domain-containing protein [Candidatus Aureabacteria bacterium]|nr:prepilin-type N-terminal cleavage/methylation domain-containing protein [Candidatus Auribacterota bacterium]